MLSETDDTELRMADTKQLTIQNADAYSVLDTQDLSHDMQPMSTGARKTWLPSFMQTHLPANRLRANEDDMSSKFESMNCKKKLKKKRRKSLAQVSPLSLLLAKSQSQRRRPVFSSASEVNYDTYVPLMKMWIKYIEELIQFSNLTDASLPVAAQKIMKADFHGCPLMVQKSKCPSYIGVHGIVLQETKNLFVLVSTDNVIKQIPKANSIFSVALHGYVFTIYGNQFTVKPGERAAKKFKSKPSIDL